MMKPNERLKLAINTLKAKKEIPSQKDFGYNLGFETESAFSQVVNGKVPFSKTLYDKIENLYPIINIEWLRDGEGEMLKDNTAGRDKEESPEEEKHTEEITGYYYPNVDAAAGLDRALMNNDIEKVPVYLPNFGKDIDFINVYGDSMYPRYNAGEIIGIKHTEFKYLNYGYPYVVVFKNGDVFIKYVRKGKDDEHILLASENPIYEPREFHLELIKDFYSIRGVVKKEMM